MSANTILLSLPAGHHVADLVRGTFLRSLLSDCPGLRVVVLSPFADDPQLRAELDEIGVVCLAPPPVRSRVTARVVDSILSEKFLIQSRLRAVRLQRDRARLLDGWWGRRTMIALKAGVCRLPVSRRAWFRLAGVVTDCAGYRRVFQTYHPSLVLTATAGFLPVEVPLIYAARRSGIPQMGVDLGWDNLSSKYHTVLPVDYLAVWNETMRDEALRFHGFRGDRVTVTGPIPFDAYRSPRTLPSRVDFVRSFGGDATRPLVTLATAPEVVYPTTDRVVATLVSAIRDGRFGADAQLLVRVHPRDVPDRYGSFHDGRQVFVEKPFEQLTRSTVVPELDAVTPGAHGRARLAATMAHSDVLVNFASTTTLEAAWFDTPIVNIGYDDTPGLPLPLSIGRYYRYEHYQAVVDTGAARIASSADDLVAAVQGYLDTPTADADARRALVKRCCGPQNGDASDRLVRWVLETLVSEAAAPGHVGSTKTVSSRSGEARGHSAVQNGASRR